MTSSFSSETKINPHTATETAMDDETLVHDIESNRYYLELPLDCCNEFMQSEFKNLFEENVRSLKSNTIREVH